MKLATLPAFALVLAACHEEPTMTFGIDVHALRSGTPPEEIQVMCRPPGEYGGGTIGYSINARGIAGPQPPPLMLETDPNAEENVYYVRVYTALEHDENGVWWGRDEVLAERSYDSSFGESREQDSFVVDFDGQQYTVEVSGLPPAATCPENDVP